MVSKISEIKLLSYSEFRKLVRCGFELETQATEGMTWRDILPNYDDDDEFREASDVYNQLTRAGLEVKEDGSVEGVEIATIGPCTIETFESALTTAFSVDHEIDTGCSFHIHVSIEGIKHKYSEVFQARLMLGLMDTITSVPGSVLTRWANSRKLNEYFRLELTKDKMCFVAHRGRTWEFRCFGNVKSVKDGMRCLELAIIAMYSAYRKTTPRIDDREAPDSVYTIYEYCAPIIEKEIARRLEIDTPLVATAA